MRGPLSYVNFAFEDVPCCLIDIIESMEFKMVCTVTRFNQDSTYLELYLSITPIKFYDGKNESHCIDEIVCIIYRHSYNLLRPPAETLCA